MGGNEVVVFKHHLIVGFNTHFSTGVVRFYWFLSHEGVVSEQFGFPLFSVTVETF